MRCDDLQRTSRNRQDKKQKLIQQPKNTNNGDPIDLRRNPQPKVQQKICLITSWGCARILRDGAATVTGDVAPKRANSKTPLPEMKANDDDDAAAQVRAACRRKAGEVDTKAQCKRLGGF